MSGPRAWPLSDCPPRATLLLRSYPDRSAGKGFVHTARWRAGRAPVAIPDAPHRPGVTESEQNVHWFALSSRAANGLPGCGWARIDFFGAGPYKDAKRAGSPR